MNPKTKSTLMLWPLICLASTAGALVTGLVLLATLNIRGSADIGVYIIQIIMMVWAMCLMSTWGSWHALSSAEPDGASTKLYAGWIYLIMGIQSFWSFWGASTNLLSASALIVGVTAFVWATLRMKQARGAVADTPAHARGLVTVVIAGIAGSCLIIGQALMGGFTCPQPWFSLITIGFDSVLLLFVLVELPYRLNR